VARRLTIVIAFVVAFSVGLVGHGLPFWAAAAIFVVASILVLQAPQRAAAGRALTWRDAAFALAVGIGSGISITVVFLERFLVRLP
jgi:preprotein translocase subunit SecY